MTSLVTVALVVATAATVVALLARDVAGLVGARHRWWLARRSLVAATTAALAVAVVLQAWQVLR